MRVPTVQVVASNLALTALMVIGIVSTASAEAAPPESFGMATMFVEAESKCFDANPGGLAMQNDCGYNDSQYWRALPAADDSYFQLTTEATPDLCLQAMPGAQSGAAMVACADEASQKWLFVGSDVEFYYRLQNQAGGDEACLEGNRVGEGAFLGGAAFLDRCSNVSGQLWRIGGAVPVNGIPVPLDELGE